MTRTQNTNKTRWGFWAAGLYLSLVSIPSIPIESISYGLMSVTTFLFLWGYMRSSDF